jgi:hypothetical protein
MLKSVGRERVRIHDRHLAKDSGRASAISRSTTSLVGDLSGAGTRVPSGFVKTLTSALASSVANV